MDLVTARDIIKSFNAKERLKENEDKRLKIKKMLDERQERHFAFLPQAAVLAFEGELRSFMDEET